MIDAEAIKLYNKKPKKAQQYITEFSVKACNYTVEEWKKLGQYLLVKYIDGNVKKEENGKFSRNEYNYPSGPLQPGYPEEWKKNVASDTGDKLLVPTSDGH